jgi:hypothetical protein
MALIFMDGFDSYSVLTDFWDFAGIDCSIRLNLGNARTGIGCLQINSAAFGPRRGFAVHSTNCLIATNWNSSGAGEVFRFMCMDTPDGIETYVRVQVNGDGSVSFLEADTGPLQGQTAPGLVTFGTYNCIAVQIKNFTLNTGEITCWVNGVQVFHATGKHTQPNYPLNQYCNGVQLMAPGGIPTCFHDDVYVLDCSASPNNTFLGALKLYALPPTANAAVAWTPLAGTNWSEVNEVPPDGDTSYVSSPNIGDVDQYVYPLTGPPAGAAILMVQHTLDMEVDSGSRSVASDVAGVPGAGVALSNGYHIYSTPYDVNPSTGVAFVAGDFPLQAGPKVTA